VVCDRVDTLLPAGAFISAYPRVAGPILVFLVQFAILDTMLTLAFLLWPGVISPNYLVVAVRLATILSGRTTPAPSS